MPQNQLFKGVTLLTGSIIGAGVFAIPFVAARAGLWLTVFYIVALGLVMLTMNLLIGEIALRTRAVRFLSGFGAQYLGRWGKGILLTTFLFLAWSAMLAYMIGEGQTWSAIFGGHPDVWSYFFIALVAAVVFFDLKGVTRVEMAASTSVMMLIILLALVAGPRVQAVNLSGLNFSKLFLPYGVVLFALSGFHAVPHLEGFFHGHQSKIRAAIIWGSLIPIILFALFTIVAVGVTGLNTTELATVGLGRALGTGAMAIGNLIAGLAMLTAGISVAFSTKRLFEWDVGVGREWAWVLTLAAPLLIFILGVRSFVTVIGAAGAVFSSLEAILLAIIYVRARRHGDIEPHRFALAHGEILAAAVIIVFAIGGGLSLLQLFK
ncbi:MAG: amino acid permease [Candidatus Magasanikbacteria bacterium]|nr:amino acid permease [Candidatus Magasanikbacteria bacterium]